MSNEFAVRLRRELRVGDFGYEYYDLTALNDPRYNTLPYSIRVLLESCVRNCDGFRVTAADVETVLNWAETSRASVEIPFMPARVILQDFTGVPAVVDLAAMRDAMRRLGGDAAQINPLVPVDLVVDHSVQVDVAGAPDAAQRNEQFEFERNRERFRFLKWGASAFRNLSIVPPGTGIVHQVNLEYLARFAFMEDGRIYPDSVVGTDSHTTMINGLGVVGWGVGGIEAEAVMLGQPVSMVLPEVVGYCLRGQLAPSVTATDLVLTVTKNLRAHGVVGKFVEFYGDGVSSLSLADRATLANMAPEYGATMGYFPVDEVTLEYLEQTGRDSDRVDSMGRYMRAQGLMRVVTDPVPKYSSTLELDLGSVVPCVAGPKRPHDRVPLTSVKQDFVASLTNPVGFKGFGLAADAAGAQATLKLGGETYQLRHGAVVIAAITSCTNTSNPSVMLAAGMVAQRARAHGLRVPAYVKMSLSPGSGVVMEYLRRSRLSEELAALGFELAGYGCMTCIGNSGPLGDEVSAAINDSNLVAAAVLSGNRNFEGRVHPLTRANYLASPPLVVAYALAGRVDIDFETEPLGVSSESGAPVFLRDLWPSRAEVAALEQRFVLASMFREVYGRVTAGTPAWNALDAPQAELYPWDAASTYIHNPPFFRTMEREPAPLSDIVDAYVLLNLGDSITTDHISPAGSIARTSPAARFLNELGVQAVDFNTYGARRGNDEVMARGTFANTRLVNKLVGKPMAKTLHVPSNEVVDIFDASARYLAAAQPVIVLAGAEYGSGSSRDWAAKGPALLGVRAVIAVSFERIHRSNLVGMGIVPLQFVAGETADSLGLKGTERFTIRLPASADALRPGMRIEVTSDAGHRFDTVLRFDTPVEITYYRHGGILPYVLRQLLLARK